MRTVQIIIALVLLPLACHAQGPAVLRHVTRILQGGTPVDGQHRITVRWYDVPVGGTPWLQEEHDVRAVVGFVDLRLGASAGIPTGLLELGSVWLGYSIDGAPEESLRDQLLSAPYARMADRALVAERLAPQVTGVVTSINEIAGAVRVVGDSGISVQRQGDVLYLRRAASAPAEHGVVRGDGRTWIFRIRPSTPLTNPTDVTIRVRAATETMIGATVAGFDAATNEVLVATTAILTVDEQLEWRVMQR
jgi:hypothetical protein